MFDEVSEEDLTILIPLLRELEDIQCQPMGDFKLTDHLVYDLKIDTDDLTELILAMQSRFEIDVPFDEWRKVGTIEQMLDVLKKYKQPI